jgi:hypothetical protein
VARQASGEDGQDDKRHQIEQNYSYLEDAHPSVVKSVELVVGQVKPSAARFVLTLRYRATPPATRAASLASASRLRRHQVRHHRGGGLQNAAGVVRVGVWLASDQVSARWQWSRLNAQ